MHKVKIVRETRNKQTARLPVYATQGSSAADVHAFIPGVRIQIQADEVAMVPTGLRFSIPEGTGLAILPRSGMGKKKIYIPNSPGLLDIDYTGELMVLLHNQTQETITIGHNERIAQIALVPMLRMDFEEASELEATERGDGGFGSTGVKAL